MKYSNRAVIFEWFDANGNKCLTRYKIIEPMDRRELRQRIKKSFAAAGIRVDNRTIDFNLKYRSYTLVEEEDPPSR